MFFISSENNNKYGVTDTKDGVEEFYSALNIKTFINAGIVIEGAKLVNNELSIIPRRENTKMKAQSKLEEILLKKLSVGLPVRIKLSRNLDFKQCLYVGEKIENSLRIFIFYDGDGVSSEVTGKFGLSSRFLKEHEKDVKFDFNNNDPVIVTKLIEKLHRGTK